MAFEEIKKKRMMDISGMEGEVGLVAGRSQREKRRSYKDLLREEEEIAAQVRKTSKKHHKDSDLFLLGGDSHKKKKKHLSDDHYDRGEGDHQSSGQPSHKKKRKSSDRSPSLSSSSSSHPSHSTDTAMGLLEAITSPLTTGSEPTLHLHKKPSYPPHTSSHSSKDRKHDGSSKSSHSYSHSRPPGSSSSKKHSSSSKSLLFHGGAPKGEPLTLCEAEGLKMKLILSSKEKNESVGMNEGLSFPTHSSSSSGLVGHHPSSSSKKGGIKKEKEKDKMMSKPPKKKQHSREPLPVVGKEVEVVGLYGGSYAGMGGDSSSSGGELEAGELVIDDSYTHLSKKKKKSKKSKKKKDKERDREKGSREKKHSKGGSGGKKSCPGDQSRSHAHSHSSSNHSSSGGMFAMAPPTSSHHHQSIELVGEKKKKKEEKDRDKHDKDKPKKKNTTAYQVFCKEYRVNINAEQPGLVFGELSKKLAEVWNQLPEKDKLVWRQKAQYLQHKQNKAEAMTVKRKTLATSDSKSKGSSKAVSLGAGLAPQGRSSLGMSLSPARIPDVDPIDAAAHLQLLGESLSLIGHRLQETEGMVAVSGSLSVLLDSILCALGPLTCLTAQVPQLNGCPRSILSNTLDNIAYIMPGL
ncbi:HMG box-containing protein 4-like isoform X1 [Cyprinus carpio]|uniref:HMG box-containing protein 4-like isoform X1 n=2 Tax=Cyprinus carpio TaxID=7962 RepID=A0A9Q9WL87_CYPCA|nr:HMG box-containing protein 4-like isoform X1 [Cyprinus carpio]XP_042585473.1 HMG box-containing protein 4-like isoform X1 [Cyprinus carpio]XP_042585480.1 HMG box-containing protein 4-like isoform X1 [Cyprinus carpio]XP_042585487.1 HMG box-containing protein 4-like isoform X1 [Cyprinus carpio]XP_042585493.1 HMG box-containing protein 4-like isoform X1 [Cyprinus carpio]XP_042585502.1 HMG box-containing protein 4-like isoform X1 [Cyprinus carpio]XP_042585513.1 HMG box-containing protein 4-lik